MFQVGDNIVYPMYGAGKINKIEEKEVLGETHSYYYVYLPHSRMDVMIPVDNSEAIGVRKIIDQTEIEKVLDILRAESDPMPANWNKRFRDNTEKLKSGDVFAVAGVVRNLVRSNRIKKLSTGEKKLLGNAKQILESELILAGGYTPEEADELVESNI